MTRMKCWLAVLAVAALAWALPVRAQQFTDGQTTHQSMQFTPTGGVVRTDSSGKMATMSSTGGVAIYDENASSAFRVFEQNWLQTRLTVGNIDSTTVLSTLGANHIYLHILPTTDSLTCSALWGIQVRRQTTSSADSMSSYVAMRWGNTVGTATPGGKAGAADTLGTRGINSYAATTTTPQVDELLFVAPNIAQAGNPRGRSVELIDRNGAPFTAARMSLRVRLIALSPGWNNGTCGADTTGRSSSIRITLEGTR